MSNKKLNLFKKRRLRNRNKIISADNKRISDLLIENNYKLKNKIKIIQYGGDHVLVKSKKNNILNKIPKKFSPP